ncbi:unnamed protein product [Schistosoma rodhaini]|nr:unnamed protein product [Schistosoma rodhaini]
MSSIDSQSIVLDTERRGSLTVEVIDPHCSHIGLAVAPIICSLIIYPRSDADRSKYLWGSFPTIMFSQSKVWIFNGVLCWCSNWCYIRGIQLFKIRFTWA